MKKWQGLEGELYLGDCLKILPTLPDDYVDLIITSPPYSEARLYLEDGNDLQVSRSVDKWVAWMVEVVQASLRVCKGMCAFVVGHGSQNNYKWDAAPALLLADLHRAGVCLRNPKWFHRVGIPGSGGKDDLRKDVEFVVCATKNQGRLPFSDIKSVSKPWEYKPGGKISHRLPDGRRVGTCHIVRDKRNSKAVGDTVTEKQTKPFDIDHANPGDLISGSVGGGRMGSKIAEENEAPFPEWLVKFFIKAWSDKGGVVLDPFMGSGTTASVAIQDSRKFVGIDLRESQIELQKRRIKQARLRKKLI